jgi:hypothetical protein
MEIIFTIKCHYLPVQLHEQATYDSVIELSDDTRERSRSADLCDDHCAIFRSKNPRLTPI